MDKQGKKALVPRLRFPEFCEDRPWSFQPLGKLARRSTKKNADGDITRVLTNSAEYGVIDQRDFFDKDIANQGNLEGYYIVEMGDYVYNPRVSVRAPVGPISKNRIGLGVMSPLYTVFRFGDKQNDFYAHYFKSTHWHHYMRQASSTGARHDRMSITNDDFMALPLPVSKPEEQQKIADCLTSLDEVIAAENQKLDTLKTYKKGLMQQLFPREGETVPRLRFPEFRETGEWCEKPLSKVCNVLQGYGFPEVLQGKSEGKYPFCKVSDISRAVAEKGGVLDEATNYVGDDELLKLKAKPVPKGATVFAKIGEALRLNRRAYVQKACLIDNNATGLKAIDGIADDYFVYLLSQLIDLNRHCGGAVPSVNKTTLEEIEVVVPGLDEQKRIAENLSSLDDLITTQSQKIDALKNHKKGLMQQLFPVLDEVPA
ncbi:restriction endonuclease subunit S [Methylobacillus flagellatus]|uniref:Restriction modification system DNA specificity domain n=1 Tax=Methylobacillus flagellatus (strain ATCC 51484 / DSM 6875 / VKM B-1610 / KT) TaxID=265072 RepID=Q1H203_METFK|nr:restriction endonuclease subunit S [Methylobacillus flagellatus]ABE49484.1 restriction modification system DNA specificity domain [Methylobacillus flagellatus KT]